MTEQELLSTIERLDLPTLLTGQFRVNAVSQLLRRMQQAENEGDEPARWVCDLLASMAILHLRPEESDAPFGNYTEIQGTHGFNEGQLTPEAVALLQAVYEQINHHALQARAADVLWVFRKDYRAGKAAVTHYLQLAEESPDDEWLEAVDALTRAKNLAKSLGKRAEERGVVADHVERHFINPTLFECWGASQLAELLLELRPDKAAELVAPLVDAAQQLEAKSDWHNAERYWQVAASASAPSDVEQARIYRVNAAETRVKMAEEALAKPGKQKLFAADWIETAIQELRSIQGTQERVGQLHRSLLSLQAASVEEFGTISHPLGEEHIENLRMTIREFMGELDLRHSLLRLGDLATEISIESLAEAARSELGSSVALHIMTTTYVNGFGRKVESSARSTDDRLLERQLQHQRYRHQTHSFLMVDEARRLLLERFSINRHDLVFLVEANPFIPEGHSFSVLLGLQAGLHGDFITAAHLLVPRLEAIIRHLAEGMGEITSKLTHQGIQDVEYLNVLLSEERFVTKLNTLMGADFVFELRGLLIERMGANFRNELAHGLAPDGLIQHYGILIWHAAWRIVTQPQRVTMARSQDSKPQQETPPSEGSAS